MQWIIRIGALCLVSGMAVMPLSSARGAEAADAAAQASPSTPEAGPKVLGMWVWQKEYVEDAAERDALFAFCKERGINRLLVQVVIDDQGIKSQEAFAAFLAEAASNGVRVEALDGAPDMGLAPNREHTLARLGQVLAFNASLPNGKSFSGVHYDIEPYLCERWKEGDIQKVALENLDTLQAIWVAVKKSDPHLTVAYDIASWYNKKPEVLTLTWGGKTQNFQNHIQDLSDYVGVMSYRRKATGPNSIVAISSSAVEYAGKIGKKVCPGVETNALMENPDITFYGLTAKDLNAAMGDVSQALGADPGFGGILVHDYRGLRRLVEQPEAKTAKE